MRVCPIDRPPFVDKMEAAVRVAAQEET